MQVFLCAYLCLCVTLPGQVFITEGHAKLWSFLNADSPFL